MEEWLPRHHAGLYADVNSRPNQATEEIPNTVVQLREGGSATSDELLVHYKDASGAHLSPVLVEIVPRMPMTPTARLAGANYIAERGSLETPTGRPFHAGQATRLGLSLALLGSSPERR